MKGLDNLSLVGTARTMPPHSSALSPLLFEEGDIKVITNIKDNNKCVEIDASIVSIVKRPSAAAGQDTVNYLYCITVEGEERLIELTNIKEINGKPKPLTDEAEEYLIKKCRKRFENLVIQF